MSHGAANHDEHTAHDLNEHENRPRPFRPLAFSFTSVIGAVVFILGMQYLLPFIWLGLVIVFFGFAFFYF